MRFILIFIFSYNLYAQVKSLDAINSREMYNRKDFQEYKEKFDQDIDQLKNKRMMNKLSIEYNGLQQEKKEYAKFKNETPDLGFCKKGFQEIDLEKTVFKDLPRDHQDGLGTCYANTSKNLIYALTRGQLNPSFIDLSLATNKREEEYLDGGSVCTIMGEIQNVGLCDKENSPLEMGEDLESLNFLNPKRRKLISHMYFIDLLNEYIKNKNQFENKIGLENFKEGIEGAVRAIQENPDIELPYPKLGKYYLPFSNAESIYYHYENYDIEKNHKLSEYLNDYDAAKDKFYQNLMKNIQDKDLDLEKIFQASFSDFSKKYKLNDEAKKRLFSDQSKRAKKRLNFSQKDYKKKVIATQNFLHSQTNLQSLNKQLYCREEIKLEHETLSNFSDIINQAKEMKVDLNKLLENNAFVDGKAFFQFVATPNCINTKNRKMISSNYTCSNRSVKDMAEWYGIDQASYLRYRVHEQLKKNMPIGKAFGTHVHTVVGMRFNENTNSCEYKIRESQTADFFWQTEEEALKGLKILAIVDRL